MRKDLRILWRSSGFPNTTSETPESCRHTRFCTFADMGEEQAEMWVRASRDDPGLEGAAQGQLASPLKKGASAGQPPNLASRGRF